MNYPPDFAFKIVPFDMVQGIMTLPPGTIWYRAYDPTKPILSDVPLFFGDIEVAYLNTRQSNRHLGEFRSIKQLRILDIRYVMAILPYILRSIGSNETEILSKIMLALGLCTFDKQIELLEKLSITEYPWLSYHLQRMKEFRTLQIKPKWVNSIELQGVRIGITNIDYEVISWLKALFYPIVDGIIAPPLATPFHDQGNADISKSIMYQELILFDPSRAVKYTVDRSIEKLAYYYLTIPFDQTYVLPHFTESLTLNTPHIRYQNAGHSDQNRCPTMKDIWGERIASDKKERQKYTTMIKKWIPTIRRIHKKHPWIQKALVCLPMAIPESN